MKIKDILDGHNINGWDKDGGTDKDTIHSYVESYEKYLSPYIDKECSLLEIGVWHGGSSLLWHDYLPKATIVGVDIENQIHESLLSKFSPRYNLHELNAYTDNAVAEIKNKYGTFDIIIEDGIHTIQSNEFALINYLPMLKEGGIMIIEDVPVNSAVEIPFGYELLHSDLIEQMIDMVPREYQVEVVDLTSIKGRYDDILFVIKK